MFFCKKSASPYSSVIFLSLFYFGDYKTGKTCYNAYYSFFIIPIEVKSWTLILLLPPFIL